MFCFLNVCSLLRVNVSWLGFLFFLFHYFNLGWEHHNLLRFSYTRAKYSYKSQDKIKVSLIILMVLLTSGLSLILSMRGNKQKKKIDADPTERLKKKKEENEVQTKISSSASLIPSTLCFNLEKLNSQILKDCVKSFVKFLLH